MTSHSGPKRPLLRFVFSVAVLLPLCFAAWWYLGAVLTMPAVWLVDVLLTNWLPDAVYGVSLNETQMVVSSALGELNGELLPAAEAGNQLVFQANTRVLSYSLPFYAALHFAIPAQDNWERFLKGVLILWLLLALCMSATALKDLMQGLGSTFLAQPGAPSGNAIALAYQFSTLIVPPLAPVLLWAYGARELPALKALLNPVPASE